MALKISISGSVGAGKSEVIKEIVKNFGYKTADVGQIFRARAIAKNMTIAEYDKFVETNPQEDIEMENDFNNLVKSSDEDIIVSRRMGFHFLPEMLTIWLDVSAEEGARRVFAQDRGKQESKYKNTNETLVANYERTHRLQQRLQKVYGVDFMDKSNYKEIIHTDGKNIDQVVEEVVKIINKYKKN